MTYGSPSSLDDVERYLTAVRGGRAPDEELLVEFRRRYEVIGGSPLIARTTDQARALEDRLGAGLAGPARDALLRAVDRRRPCASWPALGVREVVAIVLSPQYSPLLMGGYARAVEAARDALGAAAPTVTIPDAWYREPALRRGPRPAGSAAGLDALGDGGQRTIPVLLTAHSLPRRVADREPDYLEQLAESARLVAGAAGLRPERWTFCWQSAGHEPGEWMTPDFADLMPELAAPRPRPRPRRPDPVPRRPPRDPVRRRDRGPRAGRGGRPAVRPDRLAQRRPRPDRGLRRDRRADRGGQRRLTPSQARSVARNRNSGIAAAQASARMSGRAGDRISSSVNRRPKTTSLKRSCSAIGWSAG